MFFLPLVLHLGLTTWALTTWLDQRAQENSYKRKRGKWLRRTAQSGKHTSNPHHNLEIQGCL